MPKRSAIDRAIDSLEGDIAVLQAAIQKLRQQATKATIRKPRVVKVAKEA